VVAEHGDAAGGERAERDGAGEGGEHMLVDGHGGAGGEGFGGVGDDPGVGLGDGEPFGLPHEGEADHPEGDGGFEGERDGVGWDDVDAGRQVGHGLGLRLGTGMPGSRVPGCGVIIPRQGGGLRGLRGC
jgi:hypothetical protein